ncbi:MAG: hypothetical protein FWG18_00100 [Alphaproteobacteria bacterium]|nr:hypothetical protein [Alphaproteobacteria bacterium]
MKNLLVFLHGFGFDKNNNSDFISNLATELNADILALDAPFESGRAYGGFAWYPITPDTHEYILGDEFNHSVEFIKSEIDKYLREHDMTWNDVILTGRSQGAFMAMYLALTEIVQTRGIISLCGHDCNGLLEKNVKNKSVPILFCSAEFEDANRLAYHTDKILGDAGANILSIILSNSDHDNLSINAIPDVVAAARKMGII